MRIAVNYDNQPGIQGAILLLRQLGVTWQELAPSSKADLIISEKPLALKSDQMGLFFKYPERGEKIPSGVLSYKANEAYCPEPVTLPSSGGFETLALIDGRCPGIIREKNSVFVMPALFEYAAYASVASRFDERFCRTFSLDCFREIFLSLLRYCSKMLNRPLVRIWYYPQSRHTGAICCTTDIDHKMTWDILRDIENTSAIKAFLSHYIFVKYLLRFHNNKFASAYFSKSHYEQLWGKPVKLNRLITSLLKSRTFYSPLSRVYRKGIPITAFVRAGEYQKEENLSPPPKGTGRVSYSPSGLDNVELALHFGASVGVFEPCGKIDNPYQEDVFRDSIGRQKQILESDTGQPVIGTRLHNESQFAEDILEYIDKAGVLYDSSIFGGIRRSPYSPSGTALPYYPVLCKNRCYRQAGFVEIPAGVYENEQIPAGLLRKLKVPLIISQHSDSRGSNLIGKFIACRQKTWWRVYLKDLALWWRQRDSVVCNEAVSGQISISNMPQRCTIIASDGADLSYARIRSIKKQFGEVYYELEKQ